jgi:hypothetical protein
MNLTLRLLFVSALVGPVFAQDATATAAKGPLLTVRSLDPSAIYGLAMMLGEMPDLPELAAGSHYELVLGADRQARIGTAQGASAFLEIAADPPGLMQAFAKELQESRMMVQLGIGMSMQQAGIDAAAAKGIVAGLYEFPNQLERLSLVVTGNPDEVREHGMDVAIDFVAKADAPFGKTMLQIRPCGQGAPSLGGDSPMATQVSLDPESMRTVFAPMADAILGMMIAGDESAAMRTLCRSWLDLYDGGFAMAMGPAGLEMLMGLSDGAKLATQLAGDDYAAIMKAQGETNRKMDLAFEQNALQHRGATFHKITVEMDGPPNPVLPDGKMTMLQGVVGNYFLTGPEPSTKALADRAADGKLLRAALPGGAVMTMTMSMAAMAGAMGGDEMPEDAPQTMALAIVPKGKDLGIRIRLK